MSKIIPGLFYTKSHEWLKVEGKTGWIGITDFAQHQLGSVVFVDLPEAGTKVLKATEFGAVESVKAASDLLSPVSGTVVATNHELVDQPEKINVDAFEAWMIKIEITNPVELKTLLSDADYRAITK
jgi:glycine cleavage system H protein